MTETIDDTETGTIALTEAGEPEPKKTDWILGLCGMGLAYLLLRR